MYSLKSQVFQVLVWRIPE